VDIPIAGEEVWLLVLGDGKGIYVLVDFFGVANGGSLTSVVMMRDETLLKSGLGATSG